MGAGFLRAFLDHLLIRAQKYSENNPNISVGFALQIHCVKYKFVLKFLL
jgi:hypothetical protein